MISAGGDSENLSVPKLSTSNSSCNVCYNPFARPTSELRAAFQTVDFEDLPEASHNSNMLQVGALDGTPVRSGGMCQRNVVKTSPCKSQGACSLKKAHLCAFECRELRFCQIFKKNPEKCN